MGTHFSSRLICSSAMVRILQFIGFIPAKIKGQSNEVYVTHILQLMLLYNIFIMSSSLMYIFPCWLLHHHHCHVLYYSLLFYVVVTVSYCCTHVSSTIYCCVISVTVIHSYKIFLCLWYLAYRSCMCICCNSQHQNMPVNK